MSSSLLSIVIVPFRISGGVACTQDTPITTEVGTKPRSRNQARPPLPPPLEPAMTSLRTSKTAAATASGLTPLSTNSTNATRASRLNPVWRRSDSWQRTSMASLEVDSDGAAAGDANEEAADSGRSRRYPSILLQSDAEKQLAWCPLVPIRNK